MLRPHDPSAMRVSAVASHLLKSPATATDLAFASAYTNRATITVSFFTTRTVSVCLTTLGVAAFVFTLAVVWPRLLVLPRAMYPTPKAASATPRAIAGCISRRGSGSENRPPKSGGSGIVAGEGGGGASCIDVSLFSVTTAAATAGVVEIGRA